MTTRPESTDELASRPSRSGIQVNSAICSQPTGGWSYQ